MLRMRLNIKLILAAANAALDLFGVAVVGDRVVAHGSQGVVQPVQKVDRQTGDALVQLIGACLNRSNRALCARAGPQAAPAQPE
jgi:hypothetical protein